MQEIDHGAYRLHIPDDMMSRYEPRGFDDSRPERRKELLVQAFTRRRMFRELIEAWGPSTGLEGLAILDAHGNFIDSQWVIFEGEQILYPVQSWIDSLDGRAAALMIAACNPKNSQISSQKSLIFHSNRNASFPVMTFHSEVMRLYVPGEGYVEREYKKLRRIIDRLRNTQG